MFRESSNQRTLNRMIVSVLNQKGGSGKTTLSVHLAASLARDDAKVLLADADP